MAVSGSSGEIYNSEENKETEPLVRMVIEIPADDKNFNLIAGYRCDADPTVNAMKKAIDGSIETIVDVVTP